MNKLTHTHTHTHVLTHHKIYFHRLASSNLAQDVVSQSDPIEGWQWGLDYKSAAE